MSSDVSSDDFRLPGDVRPLDYHLTIRPDLSAETFTGRVTVAASVERATDTVVLNVDGLSIAEARVHPGADLAQRAALPAGLDCEVRIDEERELLHLTPAEPLTPGPIVVDITFSGVCSEKLVGLYISRYADDDGTEHKLATTQFEATHARMCFPCWDEPGYKATFALSLEVEDGHQAVANGPEVGREPIDGGLVRIDFGPTIPISSYLVAFVAGPFELTEPVDVDGVPLRVAHVPGKADLTSFALDCAAAGLRFFTDYFAIPYPDAKIDLVAIPDFAFGAMENQGCIIFREVALLADPDRATQAELQRTADVINHELAHMWFGNLVTMKWWNGLWLNEAFATFMEMLATDAYRPDWDRWTDFALSRTAAFDTDTLASTRPIEYEVIKPSDADGMFDVLTYEKGAAVVRMLEQYLGPDRFRDGIRMYMDRHRLGNAETTDLWDALEEHTGEPVRRIMDSWIFQGGYPLITVNDTDNGVTLTQHRMGYAGAETVEAQTWAVPVRFRWSTPEADQPLADRVLLDGPDPHPLDLPATTEWLVVNAAGTGFFRTSYATDRLNALAEQHSGDLTASERYALIDDTWSAVLADRSTTPAFLTLLEAMTAEEHRAVWLRMIGGFRQLSRLAGGGDAHDRLQEITHDALSPALAYLGLAPTEDDDDQRRQLRGDLVRALGTLANDGEIIDEARRTFAVGTRNPELVDAALMAAAVDIVAAHGDESDFDSIVAAWREATTPQDELRFLGALADFPDADQAATVHRMVSDGEVRSQNVPLLLRRALLNRQTGRDTWAFIAQEWDGVIASLSPGLVVRMLEGVTGLDVASDEKTVNDFFASHQVPAGERTLQQILEKQRVQVALREREADRLQRFLVS